MIRRILMAGGLVLLGAILALGFMAYRQPDLLLETINVRYCG